MYTDETESNYEGTEIFYEGTEMYYKGTEVYCEGLFSAPSMKTWNGMVASPRKRQVHWFDLKTSNGRP